MDKKIKNYAVESLVILFSIILSFYIEGRRDLAEKNSNKNYYQLIMEFYKKKKIPALLNTSLNLHGYPIASTIKEVLQTFINSDLKYLYVNDQYLIEKKND